LLEENEADLFEFLAKGTALFFTRRSVGKRNYFLNGYNVKLSKTSSAAKIIFVEGKPKSSSLSTEVLKVL
jgi:hypothetical protein